MANLSNWKILRGIIAQIEKIIGFPAGERLDTSLLTYSKSSERARRRSIINAEMSRMISSGKDCSSCVGHCCTYEHNSMQVSPLEALDAYLYLKENNRINNDLVTRLEECVRHYRLDKEPMGMGSKSFRRYYTCPFYEAKALGCSLDRESKPYGCLAFNPMKENVSEPGFCRSQVHVLEQSEDVFGSEVSQVNDRLKEALGIYWQKTNLPSALLFLIKTL